MTQTRARSSSLQRSSRAGSVKRGQRGQTPRRLSDLQERPAWDATSSNLDRFKLSAEEQERRKASRVSKNRPLASSDGKRSFVEAWAKHVTASVLREDTEHDQDRLRSTSVTRDRDLPINYGNVVEMLRKSPAAAAAAASTAQHTQQFIMTAADSLASPSGSDGAASPSAPSTEVSALPLLFGGLLAASAVAVAGQGRDAGGSSAGAAEAPGASAATGPSSGRQGGNPAQGSDVDSESAEAKRRDAGVAGAAVAPLHRGDVSITPAALRPRFNPAEATTIISFGEESDDEQDDGAPSSRASPGHGAAAATAAGGLREADPMTAAFEAALFGRRGAALGAGAGLGGGPTLAWATSRSAASPIDTAATDVERRLRALEAALGPSGRGGAAGGGGAGSALLHEEVAELRRELRQVQNDNAKLRQELGAFSSHASMLLTQLQAQVQSLLRPSGGGAGPADGVAPAAPAPMPFSSARLHPAPQQRQAQQPMGPAPGTATSVPTTATAAAAAAAAQSIVGIHGLHGSMYGIQHATSYQQQSPPQHQAAQTQPQPMARRNIFADLDISSLRPLGAAARGGAGDGDAAPSSTPHTAYRPAGSYAPGASASPLIDVGAVPYSVPVRDVDDAEVVLPSFAAFRRSAGAATFTSARPAASGATPGPLTSPHLAAPQFAAVAAAAPSGPDPSRISPSGGPAVQPRPFPTQYQPRSLGGVIVRPGSNKPPATTQVGAVAAAAAGGANATSGAYVTAVAASAAAAAATGSDAAAAALARSHSGLPQPLVFSVGPEFRTARATGLSADNSLSLSAHTAAAAAARSKASVPSSR